MPYLKFTKEVTTHLIKYVRTVDIRFNPLDSRGTAVRELWRQVSAERFAASNPKLNIKAETVGTAAPPVAKVEFVDDSEIDFTGENYDCKEMLDILFIKAEQLDIDFELEGKNIEELK
mmetsp:Transcript_22572/g.33336  ORF Transcript_22572/g.33336 Transcript_22572/m.33336 type:complete len:118 (+) Transcript_22572:173-526(+)